MKLALTKLSLVVAGAMLVAGCPKKPMRPDPGATMLGPQGAGTSTSLPPGDLGNLSGLPPGLEARPNDPWDPVTGQNREALKENTVYFDFDQSAIKASERDKLKRAKDYLDKNPGERLLLEGHCDWHGTAEYNLALGDRRANSAKRYLQSIGVPAERLETISKGSLEAAKNADDATRAKDRRVDLVVVRAKAPGGL
jgi:peptidoglycan-associated lipoprotein